MQRVLSLVVALCCSLGALHAGQERARDNRAAGASAPKPPAVAPKSTDAERPQSPRSAKNKGRPDATDYSFKVWPPQTQLGTFSADTEHGRLTCTSFGSRSCRWE